jgi:mono/diheme cytochrome c family protein
MKGALLSVVAVAIVAALAAAYWIIGPGPMAFVEGPRVALADYHVANPTGVPAALANADPVKRGEYLARAADCLVCHTARGGKDYAGGLAFPLPFGTLYSTNITPDKETGIGNYSDQDFLNAVQRGVRHDGARLYPAMPYTSYTYLTDADALAIKTYLFSLAPVRAPAAENTLKFPFDQRWLMTIWSALFNADTRFAPDTAKDPEWNRGAYLAEALAHCGECHTPRNLMFALDNRKKFAGATTAGWYAFNISADKETGIGGWSDDELVAYLSSGHARGRGSAAGPMAEAVDQSLSRMVPEDIRAIVAYIRSVPPIVSADLPRSLAPPAPASHKQGEGSANALGKQFFEGSCASCHGWTGESSVTPFATLTGARAVNDPSGTNVAQVVILGADRHGPGAVSMPAFGNTHSDTEIAAVVNYVTARFGSKPSNVTAADIARLRQEVSR